MKLSFSYKVALLAAAAPLMMAGAQAATVTISCGSVGQDEFCKKHTEEWSKKTGHEVKLFTILNSTTDILALFRQMFAAKSTDLDVINVDVVWPGVIKDHLLDLRPTPSGVPRRSISAIISNNTVGGKLLAMPWFTDAGLMFYRGPAREVRHQGAADLGGDGRRGQEDPGRRARRRQCRLPGFRVPGQGLRGPDPDAVEWISSYNGGNIVNDGARSPSTTRTRPRRSRPPPPGSAPSRRRACSTTPRRKRAACSRTATPPSCATGPTPGRWATAPTARSRARSASCRCLPGGADGKNAATLGGWQLAVSKYRRTLTPLHARHVHDEPRGAEGARDRGSYNLTIAALYKDKAVLDANPFFGSLYDVFTSAVPRPATATGAEVPQEVSAAFWNATHDVLSGKASAEDGLKKLEGKLKQVKRNQW